MQLELKNGIKLDVDQFKGIITHNDLDGIISALAIHNYLEIPIEGFFELHQSRYNYSKLIVSEELTHNNIDNFLYVDLALKHDTITSIDHHSTISNIYKNENIINANKYYSLSYDILRYGAVKYKNPTGCIHFILHLLDISIDSFTEQQKILLCLADGLHSVFNTYRENCERWLKLFSQTELIDTLKNTTYSQFDDMRMLIGSGHSSYFNYDEIQQQFTWGNGRALQDIIDNICEIMNWKKINISKMKIMYLYSNHSKLASKSNIEAIIQDDNVLSVCVNKGDGMMYYSRFTENTIDLPN